MIVLFSRITTQHTKDIKKFILKGNVRGQGSQKEKGKSCTLSEKEQMAFVAKQEKDLSLDFSLEETSVQGQELICFVGFYHYYFIKFLPSFTGSFFTIEIYFHTDLLESSSLIMKELIPSIVSKYHHSLFLQQQTTHASLPPSFLAPTALGIAMIQRQISNSAYAMHCYRPYKTAGLY